MIPGGVTGTAPVAGARGTAPPMKGFAVTGPVAEGLVAAIGRKVFAPVLDEGAPGMPIEEPVGFIPPGTTLIQFGLVIEASMS